MKKNLYKISKDNLFRAYINCSKPTQIMKVATSVYIYNKYEIQRIFQSKSG